MSDEQIRDIVIDELSNIAPEADLSTLDETTALRDALDIDSIDFLNLVIALNRRLKVAIPEADYGRLATLQGLVSYLSEKAKA
jgi:acyl carrier protein